MVHRLGPFHAATLGFGGELLLSGLLARRGKHEFFAGGEGGFIIEEAFGGLG